jgi:signal transduction histidine kinase
MKRERKKRRAALELAAMLLLIFMLVPLLSSTAWVVKDVRDVTTADELAAFDFSADVGRIQRVLFDFYPGKLYSPEELERGDIPSSDPHAADRKTVSCATCRLVLHLKAGQVYGLNGDSATYAQKLWVDGKLLSQVGTVSETADGFVPKTCNYTVYFTAGDGPTVIVMQRSNFVHASGDFFEVNLGPAGLITALTSGRLLRVELVFGAMMTASVFFLAAFFFFRERKELLYFSAACVLSAVRSSFVSPKPVMVLLPNLNWYLGHKLECCSLLAAAFFLLLFYNAVFRDVVPKWLRLTGYGLTGAAFCLYALLPSRVYSRLTGLADLVIAGYFLVYLAALLTGVFRHRSVRTPGNLLVLLGGGVSIGCGLLDALRYRHAADINLMQTGLLVLIYVVMLGIMLRMHDTELALAEASRREEAILERNRELRQLDNIRTGFLADISHEMRTPLTVMSSYAGLTKMQIKGGRVDADTLDNLDIIQHEAVRLGAMTEQIKLSCVRREQQALETDCDLNEMLAQVSRFCAPICLKNENRIELKLAPAPVRVCVVEDTIFQVLYNLITNANRHSRSSAITLSDASADGFAQARVTDRGSGMDAETLAHAFDRGYSRDGSSGLGLPLCKIIVEEHGGTIRISSVPGRGTEILFTIPLAKEGNHDEPAHSDR